MEHFLSIIEEALHNPTEHNIARAFLALSAAHGALKSLRETQSILIAENERINKDLEKLLLESLNTK